MINNNALELLNMFTKAAKIAQANNVQSVNHEINDAMIETFLKQAFPNLKDDINIACLLKSLVK